MGMFTELYPLATSTRLAMLVTADAERGLMTISVMPSPKQDATVKLTTDLTLTATPEEFDTGFVTALTSYRTELVPLLEQAAAASPCCADQTHHQTGTALCRRGRRRER
eukprot:gene32819-40509_t